MTRLFIVMYLVVAAACGVPARGLAGQVGDTTMAAPSELSQAQLESLVVPIALYPDLLLQQILAAATFPEQLLDAAMYNEQGRDPAGIKDQPWDDSVKGVANYPSILNKLASDLDWTLTLGSAFINQNEALRRALQTMRARAKAIGNLKESEQQHVIEDQGADKTTVIRIESVNPQVVYIPPNTASTLYEKPADTPSSALVPLASFGLGMALGYALGDDNDDHYYYGSAFYGPGFWYGGPAVNSWVDYRHDRWDDAYDFARDRQEWRENNRDDWREYRQELGRKQQEWRQEQKTRSGSWTPEKRAEARSRIDQARASGNITERKGSFNRDQANQRLQQHRANPEAQQRAAQLRGEPQLQERAQRSFSELPQQRAAWSYAPGGGLADMNRGQSAVNRASARGMASQARATGISRGAGGGRRR